MQLHLYISSKDPEKAASAEALLKKVLEESGADLFSLSIVDVDRDPESPHADNVTHTPTVVVTQEKVIYSFSGDSGLDEGHLRRILDLPLTD